MLEKTKIKKLKAEAHHLKPVVSLGQKGLTENVINEIEIALDSHELIKIKVGGADREAILKLGHEICDEVKAEFVHKIGHIIIIYRKKDSD